MKAAVLRACPEATLVDLTHSVRAFDLPAAAFLLWAGSRDFPAGTVHLAVVDPGVGTSRRPLAIELGGSFFVGPDNGLFEIAIREAKPHVPAAVELRRLPGVSRTFEGRDVFAPAAGRLAAGEELRSLGTEAAGLTRLAGSSRERVLWVDNFGNLVTSLRPPVKGVGIRGHDVRATAATYGEAPPATLFHYVGSLGLVEVGVREGRADRILGAGAGEPVSAL